MVREVWGQAASPPAALQGQGGDGEEQLQALHGRPLQDGFETEVRSNHVGR